MSINGIVPSFGSSSEAETIIVQIAHHLSNNGLLFAIVAGLILAGILQQCQHLIHSYLLLHQVLLKILLVVYLILNYLQKQTLLLPVFQLLQSQ